MTRRWAFALRPLKLTRGIYTYILDSSLLESDLKMSKSHVNAVSFMWWKCVSFVEFVWAKRTRLIGNKTDIGTTDEITRNQRTYVTIQDNKHRLKDLCTDSSFKTTRNGDEEVSKRSRSKSKFNCKYTCRDREPSRLRCNKKCSK